MAIGNVTVRAAAPGDLDTLIVLNDEVQRLHARLEPAYFRTDVDAEAVRTFFAELLGRADSRILIAEIRSRPVAYVWFDFQDRAATPFCPARKRIYIHHLSVSVSVRRMGVASMLMRAVEAEGDARAVTKIVLDTWVLNREAQDFFRKMDFLPFNIVLEKNLP